MPYYALTNTPQAFNPAVHVRDDMTTLDLTIEQREGDFAVARMTIVNPRAPLPGSFILISENNTLIFRGEVSQAATGRMDQRLEIEAIGRLPDFEARRNTLLQSLKTAPHYDPLFVAPDRRNEQEEILTGHGKVLAWSRTTGNVHAVDPLDGATTVELHPLKNTLREDLETDVPSSASVDLSVSWSQQGFETFNLTPQFDAFETMTPDVLESSWPAAGTQIGDGFSVSFSELTVREDRARILEHAQEPDSDEVDLAWAALAEIRRSAKIFPVRVQLEVQNRFELKRVERARLTLNANVQPILGTISENFETVELQDFTTETPVAAWAPNTTYARGVIVRDGTDLFEALEDHLSGLFRRSSFWRRVGTSPAVARRRTGSFFLTERGQAALAHAVERLRARLRYAARAARVRFQCELPANPNDLNENCRATVIDSAIPGGQATGRVVYYALKWSGVQRSAEVEVAFALGTGQGETTLTLTPPSANVPLPRGRVLVEISNGGEEQEEQFTTTGRISPTEVVITTTPAPIEQIEQEVVVGIEQSLRIPKQIEWVPVV